MESNRRHRRRRSGSKEKGGSGDERYNQHRRSRDRSRDRSDKSTRRHRTRSRSRGYSSHQNSAEAYFKDINRKSSEDYKDSKSSSRLDAGRHREDRHRDRGRDRERSRDNERNRTREREKKDRDDNGKHRNIEDRGRDRDRERERERTRDLLSDESDDSSHSHYYNKVPSNTVIVLGLQPHVTEADIMSTLIRTNTVVGSIRLIRKRNTGASRGFAFVEFNTVDEARVWMESNQGVLTLTDNTRAAMEYSHRSEVATARVAKVAQTDWFCGKCGVFNFKRRGSCFKCFASREESEAGGEGSDEISNILTKKIMLRNLDALTNEEGVLTALQEYAPNMAPRINKILISRDRLTQTSRGICYLSFESLIDSMNIHNALTMLDSPLKIDGRDVMVSYCIDHENRQIVPKNTAASRLGSMSAGDQSLGLSEKPNTDNSLALNLNYTLADVPRLAQYSAAMYASTPSEHAHYLKYYTDYYIAEINKGTLCQDTPVEEVSANSAAAVALSAIQRKQKKMNRIETTASPIVAAISASKTLSPHTLVPPDGTDDKIYPTPDVTQYQYDESSGYYYDPTTGLYYDANSQYYYNSEKAVYLYWYQKKRTYILATPTADESTVGKAADNPEITEAKPIQSGPANSEVIKSKKEPAVKQDKVKVAKKIVKDMEKWAKQLNEKKDYTVLAAPQPFFATKNISEDMSNRDTSVGSSGQTNATSGYADVCFSILEKKETSKLVDYVSTTTRSDSEDDQPVTTKIAEPTEKNLIDFQRLTCLLCKRAFQSLDILQKHIKMSNLHKENLEKHKLNNNAMEEPSDTDAASIAMQSYRDRAKERRKKYGESDPPPVNRSLERFESKRKILQAERSKAVAAPITPIDSSNVGNRLLQKMGWSEGQGLGKKNQGRTNIIEAGTRTSTAGLGSKAGAPAPEPGDDYKTYVKKMMKARYESV